MVGEGRVAAKTAGAVGCAGICLLALQASGSLGRFTSLPMLVLGLAATGIAADGLIRRRLRPWWLWAPMLAAMTLFIVGGILRLQFGTLGDLSSHRSVIPDLITLPGYLFMIAMMLGLARLRHADGSPDLAVTLDAILATIAVLALAWVFLISPALVNAHAAPTPRLMVVIYPTMSVFLVAFGFRTVFSSEQARPAALRLLFLVLACVLVGDVMYMLTDARIAAVDQRFLDLAYGLAYVVAAVALLHPSVTEVAETVPAAPAERQRSRLAVVVAALCVPALLTLGTPATAGDRRVIMVLVVAGAITAAFRLSHALREHSQAAARLAHQATHDSLTGLPNRTYLQTYLDRLLARPGGDHVALLLLDMDRFRLINDTLGHDVGDELLVAVGQRLRANSRAGDLVARIGGDEFVIVTAGLREAGNAREAAERTRLSLSVSFAVADAEIPMSASIGVALHDPADHRRTTSGSLIRDADNAMYQAKDRGGDVVAVFDHSMRRAAAHRLDLERELRHAKERGELHVAYQPIVRADLPRVIGFEALLRWTHPRLGEVQPSDFIPIAEDTGAIVEIGAWVLDRALGDLATLQSILPHGEGLFMAVNLSVRQLRDDSLLDHVARALLRAQLPSSALRLELTESMVMENLSVISKLLMSLRSCGVRISVDDFGTGYSSLATLDRLPVDEVKIDKSFVDGIADRGANTALVSAIVAIAESLGMTTIAEGVETVAQASQLRRLGCGVQQGYLYAHPVSVLEVPRAVREMEATHPRPLRSVPDTAGGRRRPEFSGQAIAAIAPAGTAEGTQSG